MPAVSWIPVATDGQARAGWLDTPHGRVRTPAFMPVGTRAAVKAVDVDDLQAVGAEIVLGNTYHLMLRPGADLIASLGGIQAFMGWDLPVLTDSGGFQIFSLGPAIDEDGASFRSVYDGAMVRLTPEDAVRVQEQLGADIAMSLDVCVGLPAPRELVEAEMRRTLRWGERCLQAHSRTDQALFGIVQGGADPELRAESAAATAELPFDGYAIGGLAVGETVAERNRAIEVTNALLPTGRPRYVMGLGDPEGLLEAIARGADMFDCVIPTRLGRHGKVMTSRGDFSLKRAQHASDDQPIDHDCACLTCSRHSRAYLRHLVMSRELSAHRLLSIHNLRYLLDLTESAAKAIEAGTFAAFANAVTERRAGSSYDVRGA